MTMTIQKEVANLEQMTVAELRRKYTEVYKEPTRSHNREHLVMRIAWRLQAEQEGGISERAKRRAAKIANEADLRTNAPQSTKKEIAGVTVKGTLPVKHDSRIPMPGTIITRKYKGRILHVHVRHEGFEFENKLYRSLTALATEITGSHWNGYNFFKLKKKEKK